MTQRKPTDEQQAILDAARGRSESLMIRAYAGTGKTTTLEMLAHVLPRRPSLAVAFNKKIAVELQSRFPQHFEVKTMNGLGHSAWQRAIGKRLQLEEKKLGKLITQVAKARGFEASSDQWYAIRQLVTGAMQLGMCPQGTRKGLIEDDAQTWMDIAEAKWIELGSQSEPLIDVARAVLKENVNMAMEGIISFDDQIYMSTMFGGVFPQFPLVMVDEAQDLSPLNHIQIARVAGQNGRYIICGDPMQAIYAFRGADSQSMGKIKSLRKEWIELPLATTFRCPKVVVERQQGHAKGYKAFETAPLGEFIRLPIPVRAAEPRPQASTEVLETSTGVDGALAEQGVQLSRREPIAESWNLDSITHTTAQRDIAILCRNNAPLLSIAFKLIRQGVGVQMLGRDIGKGLIALAKKLAPADTAPVVDVIKTVREWADKECALALVNDNEQKAEGIRDRAECIIAAAEAQGVAAAGDLRRALGDLFDCSHGVTLATGHRAKGLEWNTVIHLDPWHIPSKYARKNPSQMEQEMNLKYVLETRAKHTLIEANLEDFE